MLTPSAFDKLQYEPAEGASSINKLQQGGFATISTIF
jgi:hypothetical protein